MNELSIFYVDLQLQYVLVAWHPVHEGMFSSGGSDGSIIFWNVDQEKEVGSIEQVRISIIKRECRKIKGHMVYGY